MENFKSFDELFENAIRYGSIEQPKDTAHKETIRSYYNFAFNEWLSQNKGWKFGDTKSYMKFLTRAYWLEFKQHEDTLKSKSKFEFEEIKKSWQSSSADTKTDKLKVNQIALIHVYEGVQITRENAGEIAAKHGYTAKNSGEGLFQDYTNYCSTANRKGKPTPCTPKKLKNKIELFESVVSHLSDNNKQRAIDEINILKTIFENEYQ